MSPTLSATDLALVARYLTDYAKVLRKNSHTSTADANRARLVCKLLKKISPNHRDSSAARIKPTNSNKK